MSDDDILELAYSDEHILILHDNAPNSDIIKFARVIAAKEREACVLACENEKTRFANQQDNTKDFDLCIAAIRARGE